MPQTKKPDKYGSKKITSDLLILFPAGKQMQLPEVQQIL